MFVQLPIVAFLCAALVLVPTPWHWRAGNIATLSVSAWLFASNVIYGIGAIVWGDTVLNVAPIWCDIATKIQIGSNVALPAAMLCLCMHLERISSVRQVKTTHSDKRRRQLFDLVLCFGIPVVYMALHYVVQGHRFDIVEGFGCRPTIYESVASIFLIWIPPLVLSVMGCIFASMAFAHFWRRRITFARHLHNSNSALTTSRYFRLMFMAVVEMFQGIVVTSLNMWFSLRPGLRPWISWANVHSNFSEIAYFPLVFIPKAELAWTFALWSVIPASSFLFFVFFAFGQDAMREYSATFSWICHTFLRIPRLINVVHTNSKGSARWPSCAGPNLEISVSKIREAFPPCTPHSTDSFETSCASHLPLPYVDSRLSDDTECDVPPYVEIGRPCTDSTLEKGDACARFCAV